MSLASVNEVELSEIFGGAPLTVVFADDEPLAAAREQGCETIALEPPFHVSDEDIYLVLPSNLGHEMIDILADGDDELLDAALDEGLVVLGSIEREGRGEVVLHIDEALTPRNLLDSGLEYATEVRVGGRHDAVGELNALEHLQLTVASEFIDDDGLERLLVEPEYIGQSWKAPEDAAHLEGVDPTYVWSRRLPDGRVGVEAVFFSEYEELVVVLRPCALKPALAAI